MTIAVAAMAIGTAFQAVGAIQQGKAQARAYELQAQAAELEADQHQIDAEMAAIEGQRQEIARRRELERLNAANLATVGYDAFSSPSFMAIEQTNRREAEKDLSFIGLSTINQRVSAWRRANQSFLEAGASRDAARSARAGGFIRAAGTVFTGASRAAQL